MYELSGEDIQSAIADLDPDGMTQSEVAAALEPDESAIDLGDGGMSN